MANIIGQIVILLGQIQVEQGSIDLQPYATYELLLLGILTYYR